jgi:hypothetical protein
MRTLRTAINFGFFAEVQEKGQPLRYRNNRLSAVLREDHAQSQKFMVRHGATPLFCVTYHDLYSVPPRHETCVLLVSHPPLNKELE